MRFFLISDSHDALTGMRLAGIEGVFAKTKEEAETEIDKCIDDESIGIVLITEALSSICRELIDSIKLGRSKPLIVTVPGSKNEQGENGIMRYVHEAIGIKIDV